ncbi:PREDICTED: PDZ domain-containing protein MAGIX isoform X2 [Odobenus rosmarus divergens]|uniref:PDZ domain-containing protein MAGIX isoform X2 n=1 Tax=Odobenus rosmarus divergens TaxID=9708 RepID=A0A2U3VP31_ODORO|nr:PREDICTED: PDZ domain-containing protein MAGIX isoform X2 [Odobenus rosmarus divergens]
MQPRAGAATDPRGSRGGRGLPLRAGPRARQLLARLDARPLAARAAADVAALVRRTGATLRLRPNAAVSVLDSADIEVTDSRLPNPTFVEHRPQAGDLVLHINGESTQGLTHAQVVERIRTGGPRLRLVLSRPLETHPGQPEGVGGPQKGDGLPSPDRSPDPGGPEVMRSRSVSASPLQHPPSGTAARTPGSPEPSPEPLADCPAVSPPERRTEDPDDRTPGSPGPWLVPSEERLSRALGIPGAAQLALEMAAGRRRH